MWKGNNLLLTSLAVWKRNDVKALAIASARTRGRCNPIVALQS